ncbi:MAG: Uma2 family endonuclease [Bacteroidota bacterium]
MVVNVEKRLLTVAEYHKMAEVGILDPDDRVELIKGEIIKMSPLNSPHTSPVKRITSLMYQLFGNRLTISVQDPITIEDHSEPEPDIALLAFSKDFYAERHPRPEDVILLIEVADSTVAKDQQLKLPLYAEAGIKEYWIVNIVEKQLEVYQQPKDSSYTIQKIYTSRDQVRLENLGATINVNSILG